MLERQRGTSSPSGTTSSVDRHHSSDRSAPLSRGGRGGVTAPVLVAVAMLVGSVLAGLSMTPGLFEIESRDDAGQVADTMQVYTQQFDASGGGAALHVEQFGVPPVPGGRYRLVVTNGGSSGAGQVAQASVTLNSVDFLVDETFASGSTMTFDGLTLAGLNDLQVSVSGGAGEFITVALFQVTTATTVVFGPVELIRTSGPTTTQQWTFDVPPTATDPYTLTINSGYADGSGRAVAAWVYLNNDLIFEADQFEDTIAVYEAEVSLLPVGNVLELELAGKKGVRIEAIITGILADTTAPSVSIDQPMPGFVTSDDSVFVSGAVSDDQPGVQVTVNGTQALVVGDTAYSATVPLLAEGANVITVIATDAAGKQTQQMITVIRDTQAPVLSVVAPADSLITSVTPTPLTGSVTDATTASVDVNGVPVATDSTGAFTDVVALTEGTNVLTVTATDPANNQTVVVRTVILDSAPPVVTLTEPADSTVTADPTLTVSGTVTDATAVTVDANGVPLPVDGAGVFTGQITLTEGANVVTVTATDAAGNTVQTARVVTLDTTAPVLVVTAPQDGSTTQADSVAVSGTVTDATATTVTLNSVPLTVDGAGAFTGQIALSLGPNTLTFLATDAAGNTATQVVTVTREDPLPPDPELVAPDLDQTVSTTTFAATEFLYTGTDPIQTGVAPGTIDPVRTAVLRGRVLDVAGQPLSGVAVSVLDRTEFGQTLTRADGEYDLVVNGGHHVTVRFTRTGYFEAQRQVDVPWRDYVVLDDVALVQPDTNTAIIDLAQPIQVARGSVESDASGPRQGTILFPAGNSATMIMPDSSTQPLSSMTVRVTEYTASPQGRLAMPAELPPTTAYTYAVEVSVEEAEAAGALRVEFQQPVPYYLENFLGVPVGGVVPAGYYDREAAEWVAEPDGIVLAITGVSAGQAQLDISGDGTPETFAELQAALGVTTDELEELAQLYPVGQELWRIGLGHFSPWDFNYRPGFPGDAVAPDFDPDAPGEGIDDPCTQPGSVIECENQVLGETIGLVGVPYSLNYRSNRVTGRRVPFRIGVPLTSDTPPLTLQKVYMEAAVAGRRIVEEFEPAANLEHTFEWDGLDAYGRPVVGVQRIRIRVIYEYPVVIRVGGTSGQSFGSSTGPVIAFLQLADTARFGRIATTWEGTVGAAVLSVDGFGQGVGGWTLSAHHAYDYTSQTLVMGTGERMSASSLPPGISTVAGTGVMRPLGTFPDGQLALSAQLQQPADVEIGPDGLMYFSELTSGRVYRVDENGLIETVAGGGSLEPEGVLATDALIGALGIEFGPDGTLYIADRVRRAVLRVDEAGLIHRVAGNVNSSTGFGGDGGPATADSARFTTVEDIAVAPDGTIYIADFGNRRVRRVGTDGMLSTVAGNGGTYPHWPQGIDALEASIDNPSAVAVGPGGSLFIAAQNRVIELRTDGSLHHYAGSSVFGSTGDGGLATNADIEPPRAGGIAFDRSGNLYFTESYVSGRVRRVSPDRVIRTVAGTGSLGATADGVSLATGFARPQGIAFAPGGELIIADIDGHKIRQSRALLPGFDNVEHQVRLPASELMFEFDAAGRHHATLNERTGVVLQTMGYDSDGRLVSITDLDGLVTTVQRDAEGLPTAVVGPFSQTTTLTTDTAGYLTTVTNPAGETVTLEHTALGLLTSAVTPAGDTTTFQYDSLGHFAEEQDPTGRTVTLAATSTDSTRTSVFTTAFGSTAYETLDSSVGSTTRTQTSATGEVSLLTVTDEGRREVLNADGTAIMSLTKPDPYYGIQRPVVDSMTVTTPGGLTATMHSGVAFTATLDSAGLPVLLTRTDTLIRNDQISLVSWDRATRQTIATSPEGRQTTATEDANGRLVRIEAPGVHAVDFTRDGLGRVTQMDQGGRSWTFSYDGSGRLSGTQNPLSQSVTFGYDLADRVTSQTNPDGSVIGFRYDVNGDLVGVTPAGRPEHGLEYDAVRRLTAYAPPDTTALGGALYYEHDVDGRLTSYRTSAGDSIVYTYDASDRVTGAAVSRGTYSYGYDGVTGRLTSTASPDGATQTFTYDGALLTGASWAGAVTGSVGFSYDNHFRLSQETVNGGNAVTFNYDTDGLLTQAGNATLSRDAQNGLLTSLTVGGASTSYGYDPYGELASEATTVGGYGTAAFTYQRDSIGRVATQTVAFPADTAVWGYGYDAAGRLATVTLNGESYASYTYDGNGNRLTVTDAGGTTSATHNSQDQLTTLGTATYEYDRSGALERKIAGPDTTAYAYDLLGNLLQADLPNGDVVEYVIDGQQRRVSRKLNGTLEQQFVYRDGLNPVAELDGTGALVSRFVYGSRAQVPDYMDKGGQRYRLITDQLGSVRLVVDVATGVVAQRIDYGPWGEVLQDTNPGFQPFGYTGGIWDGALGLVRLGARDYDPEAGRWTAPDPIGFGGGASNLYAYSFEDPVNSRDPSGLQGLPGAVLGAIAGAVGGYISGGAPGLAAGAFAGFAVGVLAAPQSWQAGALAGAGASFLGQAAGRSVTSGIDCWREVFDLSEFDWFAVFGAGVGGGVAFSPAASASSAVNRAALERATSLGGLDRAPAWGAIAKSLLEGVFGGIGEAMGSWFGQGLPGGRQLGSP